MQRLDVSGFNREEVVQALHASSRTVAFKYELLDSDNEHKDWIDGVLGCSVENNTLANIKRTAKVDVHDIGQVDWLSDRIRPWYLLWMGNDWAEWPLGVYLLSSPEKQVRLSGSVRQVEAYDQILILKDDKVEDRYTISQGTNYITAIGTLLDTAGVTGRHLVHTDKTLPTDRDWKPGTSKYEIIQDLLSAVNYRSMYFDSSGLAVAKPYQSPKDRPVGYEYAADRKSLLEPDVDVNFDLFDVANKWVVTVSEPDRPELTSSYTNDEPDSPTSTVNRGRTIVDVRDEDAADQEALDAKVQRLAFEASQVYEIVEMNTAIMPHHEDNELLMLTYEEAELEARYTEHKWSMDLKAGASMKHTLRRVVNI